MTRLLLVEDNPRDADIVLRHLLSHPGGNDFDVTHVGTMFAAERHLAREAVDIVLLDLGLPDSSGAEAVRRTRAAAPHVALVVLTGLADEALAGQMLQEGAQDHLIKGQNDQRGLIRALRYAVERKSLESQRDAMEEALFLEKERAEVTLKSIGEAVVCTDASGLITFLNREAEQMTGWSGIEAAGQPFGNVLVIADAANHHTIPDPMNMAVGENRTVHLPPNCILVRRDGREIPIEDSVAPIHGREGQCVGAVIVFRDVSATRAMALEIAHRAQHDILTGLPNRMLFRDRVTQAIALGSRQRNSVVVMFLDVNGFKHINDSLGHSIGDKLLQSIANRLAGCVRGSDTVSRQGGDEFVILLPELAATEDGAVVARRLLQAVATTQSIDEHDIQVTASIGVSAYPGDGLDAETLIKNADTAMYQAKEQGPNSYRFFEPSMNVRAVERQSIEQSMRMAMERQEFSLHYQPKVDLRTGRIIGAEALLRWRHPVRGQVPPLEFIPVAEECGLILPIGRWVLREACLQAKAWTDAGLSLGTIAVNISAVEFRSDTFLEGVFAILHETGLDPGSLELELTETVLMRRAHSTGSILQGLTERGVQLAVDDFGTGYSSLSYLQSFPIRTLKIDRSFIRQISQVAGETTIVNAVIGMGHNLNLRVVAEGIETQEQLAFLRDHGCDEGQGFYFSRPLGAEDFVKLLAAGVVDTVHT